MSISMQCGCGKRLAVKDELAGKRIKCPGCGRTIVVEQTESYALTEPVAETVPSVRVCPSCGANQPTDAFVCIYCKTALPSGQEVTKTESKKQKLGSAKKKVKDEGADLKSWQYRVFAMPAVALAGSLCVGLALHISDSYPWSFARAPVAVFFCWALSCGYYFHTLGIGTLRKKAEAAPIESVGKRWRQLDYWIVAMMVLSLLIIIATLVLVAPSGAWTAVEPNAVQAR